MPASAAAAADRPADAVGGPLPLRPRRTDSIRGGRWSGPAFLAPSLLLFAVFVLYPIVYNVQASLLDWDGINAGIFLGVDNYRSLVADPVVATIARNSLWWILLTVLPQMLIGFGFALLLDRRVRARNFYRVVFFLPAILSPVVVGIVWQRIYDPFSGVISGVGGLLGVDWLSQGWLAQPSTAIFACIAVNVWMWTGFSMLFYLAGLQGIDESALEAAEVDGASPWQRTWRIVWPLLRPTHLSLILLGIIGSLRTFELIYMLTQGGPNHASEMLPTYTFQQAFQLQRVGYGASLSVVLLVVAMGASLAMVRAFGAGFLSGDEP